MLHENIFESVKTRIDLRSQLPVLAVTGCNPTIGTGRCAAALAHAWWQYIYSQPHTSHGANIAAPPIQIMASSLFTLMMDDRPNQAQRGLYLSHGEGSNLCGSYTVFFASQFVKSRFHADLMPFGTFQRESMCHDLCFEND